MPKTQAVDIVIIGAGIAGLWLLNRLRQLGCAAILLESNTLGGGQTNKAQGIIHGGMKFALQGSMTQAAQTIADMPSVWGQCLQGRGEIDLSRVPILSSHQYLFSTGKLSGRLTGFFANVALQGRVSQLQASAYPQVFQHPKFKGLVYALEEMAIDVNALIHELVKPHRDVIFKIEPLQEEQIKISADGSLKTLTITNAEGDTVEISANKFIFTAGAGNELIARKLPTGTVTTQRRPLHMVVVKTDFTYPVFAHCFGMSSTPRMTITTHQAQDGKMVWYLGGQIAEEGMNRSPSEQACFAQKELQDIFPWLDFSTAKFASFHIDRAEPQQPGGKRPDDAYMQEIKNIIVAWPTKLALAPRLAQQILFTLPKSESAQQSINLENMQGFQLPAFATPIWDELLC